jgi:hypothetical protein
MPRNRRNLVIDADIVHSAGPAHTLDQRSSICRSVLDEIQGADHSIVLSRALNREWMRHMSSYASDWLVAMQSSGRVIRLKDDELPDLAEMLDRCACADGPQNRLQAMRKDIHLLETALAERAGKCVISGDERVRTYLLVHTACDRRIAVVVWVNPTIEEHHCLDWLKAGAKNERQRQLRNQAKASAPS